MDSLGLYLSVPFCKSKCTFCNFASDAFPAESMAAYVEQLCNEIEHAHEFTDKSDLRLPQHVDTVFIGGGTPSLLAPADMSRIFSTIRENFQVDDEAEITVEAAPGQISEEMLDALLRCGVNRVSLGVQSFVDREASAVGRVHTGDTCIAELKRLRSAGMRDLNVDLIAGLPYQTSESWEHSLGTAVASGVDHVSVYMLEVDEDSRLGRELIGPGVRYSAQAAPGESLVADLYMQACELMNVAGLQQYEISNFASQSHRSRHNCKYWTRSPYLGFGLDAHSMLKSNMDGAAVRFANSDEFETYMTDLQERDPEHIDLLAAFEESIFLGLRLVEGVSIADLRANYPCAWIDSLAATARDLAADDMMTVSHGSLALTQRGRILSSSVFGELLAGGPTAS